LLQNPRQTNGDNVNNLRREASRTFKNKMREFMEEKLMSSKQTVRTRISETHIEAQMNLRSDTNIELTY